MSMWRWEAALAVLRASRADAVVRIDRPPSLPVKRIEYRSLNLCTTFIRCLGAIIPVAAQAQPVATVTAKYICVVSHMAGIQHEKDGRVSTGNFKPASEKFFLTIGRISREEKCPWDATFGKTYWLACVAKYMAEIDNDPPMRGDNGSDFYGLFAADYFSFNEDDLRFVRSRRAGCYRSLSHWRNDISGR